MTMLDRMQPALRSLLNLENERSAARNALIMRSDEAKAHMEEARRHYQDAVQAFKQELREGSSKGHATTSTEPDRQRLGPTRPTQVKADPEPSYEDKHPNPGNIGEAPPGPMPSADPNDKAGQLENAIEKKRVPPG
jgi:hypothetical protein